MNKKKYIVPNVVVRTRRLLVSPIMGSRTYSLGMKADNYSSLFDSTCQSVSTMNYNGFDTGFEDNTSGIWGGFGN